MGTRTSVMPSASSTCCRRSARIVSRASPVPVTSALSNLSPEGNDVGFRTPGSPAAEAARSTDGYSTGFAGSTTESSLSNTIMGPSSPAALFRAPSFSMRAGSISIAANERTRNRSSAFCAATRTAGTVNSAPANTTAAAAASTGCQRKPCFCGASSDCRSCSRSERA